MGIGEVGDAVNWCFAEVLARGLGVGALLRASSNVHHAVTAILARAVSSFHRDLPP